MKRSLSQIEPDWDEDDMDKILNHIIEERLQLPEVVLDNNYTGESRATNILSVMDWAIKRKPLVAGNATFYKNQHEAINPIAQMLDGFLKERKALKKKMFVVGEEQGTECDLYKDLDRGQQNQKILANSYYGASGMPKSAFYSKWSGPEIVAGPYIVIYSKKTLLIAGNSCYMSNTKLIYHLYKWQ